MLMVFMKESFSENWGACTDMTFPRSVNIDIHKGEVLYVTISQIITNSYVICFNNTVSLISYALTGTASSVC